MNDPKKPAHEPDATFEASMKSYRPIWHVGDSGPKCACPCCGYRTLSERGGFEICPVCFWEDDGQDDEDADVVRGGPNHSLSLTEARRNFREFGASDWERRGYVRNPTAEEL